MALVTADVSEERIASIIGEDIIHSLRIQVKSNYSFGPNHLSYSLFPDISKNTIRVVPGSIPGVTRFSEI
jgi:hypothetical protein